MSSQFSMDPQNVFYRCVEDSNEAIMISDAKGALVYVNPAWQRIYGYSSDEAIGQTPALLHSGYQPDEFYREMWAQIRDPEKGSWKGELINRAKDGTLVPVLLSITPFKGKDGAINGYMGIALDHTQRKDLESKVVHQDRLASIGMLASGLAHEVGTPLGVARGRAEFLMMKSGDDPIYKKDLEVIIAQIDRISKLIRSLLRMSRSFSDVRVEELRVESAVSEVITLLGQNFRSESVVISAQIPTELMARADSSRLEQVLMNLFMNSLHAIKKAMLDGRTERHELRIVASQRKSKVAIDVTDTGCGIAPENMKKLFRPFFTTKDVGEGTGLGLAIVAQLIREMDGEISVQSMAGQGTTFTVLLNAP